MTTLPTSHEVFQIIAKCESEGFNPSTIYCKVTGAPTGYMLMDELRVVIAQILPCDEDDLISELWTRTMASARPSPAWNVIRRDSLDKMLRHSPKHLLAYLMNRLYDPRDSKPSLDSQLGVIAGHIRVWDTIARNTLTDEHLNQLLLVLLNIDTRHGLRNHPIAANLFSYGWALAKEEDVAALILQLNDWLESLDKKLEALEKRGLQQARAGNSLTRQSFATQFLKATPPSRTREKALAKQAEKDLFANALDAIFSDAGINESADRVVKPSPAPEAIRPADPVPAPAPRRLKFGVKGN